MRRESVEFFYLMRLIVDIYGHSFALLRRRIMRFNLKEYNKNTISQRTHDIIKHHYCVKMTPRRRFGLKITTMVMFCACWVHIHKSMLFISWRCQETHHVLWPKDSPHKGSVIWIALPCECAVVYFNNNGHQWDFLHRKDQQRGALTISLSYISLIELSKKWDTGELRRIIKLTLM